VPIMVVMMLMFQNKKIMGAVCTSVAAAADHGVAGDGGDVCGGSGVVCDVEEETIMTSGIIS